MGSALLNEEAKKLAKKYNLKPILIGFALVFFCFVFFKLYCDFNVRETLLYKWFIVLGSAIIIIASFINCFYKVMNSVRIFLCVCILVFVILLLVGIYGTPLSSEYVVVTITKFKPVGDNVAVDSDNLTYRIENIISNINNKDIPIKVRRIDNYVDGINHEERINNAITLGKSIIGRGHIVIWGDVFKDENQLQIKPYITLANTNKQIGKINIYGERVYTSNGPDYLSFKKQISDSISDLLFFAMATAYYNGGYIEKAYKLFDKTYVKEKYYYKALCCEYLADSLNKPLTYYNQAIDLYDSLIALCGIGDTLWVSAKLNSTNDKLCLLRYYQKEKSLLSSNIIYKDYVSIVNRLTKPLDIFVLANNMSLVANILTDKYGDTNYISTNLKYLDSTSNILKATNNTQWLPYCYNNSGILWGDLMNRSKANTDYYFRNARSSFNECSKYLPTVDTIIQGAYYINLATLFINYSTNLSDVKIKRLFLDSAKYQLNIVTNILSDDINPAYKSAYVYLLSGYSDIESDNDKRTKYMVEAIDTLNMLHNKFYSKYKNDLEWAYSYFYKAMLCYRICVKLKNDTVILYEYPKVIDIGINAVDSANLIYSEYKSVDKLKDLSEIKNRLLDVKKHFINKGKQ